MTHVFDGLDLGFQVALSPHNLWYCLIGCLVGTLVGVLPGLGPVATVAILLPVTYQLEPASSLIMLAGIYYGAQYGGSTTAILMKIPGESSSVVTCLDGHMMARNGRAGSALAIAALGSFAAGTLATIVVAVFAPPLGEVALAFAAPEYFVLMCVGLVLAAVLSQASVARSLAMVVLGLVLGCVGSDVNSGVYRFVFDRNELVEGIGFVPLAMGLFGLPEIINSLATSSRGHGIPVIGSLFPSRAELREATPATLRGTAIGSVFGILPGGGSVLGAFASYLVEKKLSRRPELFGRGAVAGLAGPESANNAAAQTGFIPLLTLGIPPNAGLAILVGAMMIQGVAPGPEIITKQPELFWGVIASMWIGNLMLVIINLPLIGIWVSMLRIPFHLLYPFILVACIIGIYSVNNSYFDILLTAGFGLLGYLLLRFRFDPTPLIIAFVMGPMMEESFRRALLISQGDPSVFVMRPISAGLLALLTLVLLSLLAPRLRRARSAAMNA